MQLNLSVLSLNKIDNLSYQKCLIPQQQFPSNARPGQWAKCYLSEKRNGIENFAIVQIFPRKELENVCYLDKTITDQRIDDKEEMLLTKLELLEGKEQCKIVNMSFVLNTQDFIENSGKPTKTYLLELGKTLLQKYQLWKKCSIRDEFLLDYDETNVNIKNISLNSNTINQDLVYLNAQPIERARQELDDLMKLVRIQRSQKRSLCLSLNTLLVGAVGSGKSCLVEEFLKRHHCNVFRVNITSCLKQYPGETEAELRKIFKAACDFETKFKSKDPTVILLEEINLLCPQSNSYAGNNSEALANSMRISGELLSLVDDIHCNKINIMCIATTSKPDNLNELVRRSGRFDNEIYIAALQEEHRKEILGQLLLKALKDLKISSEILDLMAKQTQGYVLADLDLLVRNFTQKTLTKIDENIENTINVFLKKSKPISLKGTDVTAYRTTETFDSIGGMFELKKTLEVSVLAGLKQREAFARFGLNLPKGVLLYGPPGCAKTTIAKCLATEANMTFIATSGAEVYSPYVGCAEKFIAKIFQTARKNAPCVIFLDEIDSLVGRRSLGGSSNSADVQVRILSTLLTEMDGVITSSAQTANILVVAATNRPDMVDDALMRPGRFDKLIHVPAPDFLSRRSILELYKQKMPFSVFIDLDKLATETENYSGADICNLCNEAAMQAFQRDFNCKEIIAEDFNNVLKTLKSSLVQSQIDWYYQFENKL
ncbi:ATPase family gene 2 protein homolog B isoform 2-T2 [Cochliomyia hominivorax]